LSRDTFGDSVFQILSKVLEVIEFRPLSINSAIYEHGLMPFSEALSDQFSGPLFICGASF